MTKKNLRSERLFYLTHWDWSFLNWAFNGTKIAVQDIDGHVEHKGYNLFLETKLPGTTIPLAQAVTHLSWQDRGDTVMVIWGKDNEAEKVRLYNANGGILQGPANNIDVALLVRGWYLWVESQVRRRRHYDLDRLKIKPLQPLLDSLFTRIKDHG